MDRRKFIRSAGLTLPVTGLLPAGAVAFIGQARHGSVVRGQRLTEIDEAADYTIRIGTGLRWGRSILFQLLPIMVSSRGRSCALRRAADGSRYLQRH